ncbi:hypothetical protein OC834_006958 [Tilletia horrida]|nr:hypothetical protein OC834_006958 [Tilletia horrida]KAK0532388.1 hypothetical protein OC835_003354 [Tilletia horrida]
MYLLGAHLPDHKLVHIALCNFLGINQHTARRLCARLQLHESAKVSSLTEAQITQLSAFLSSPSSIPARAGAPTSPVPITLAAVKRAAEGKAVPSSSSAPSSSSRPAASAAKESRSAVAANPLTLPPSQRPSPSTDPLRSLVLEADLRRQIRANIAHHRMVGSYKGRRHAAGLPVRGQRTQTNANTARKLNRLERRAYSTATAAAGPSASSSTAGLWDGLSAGLASLFLGRR